MTPTIIQTSLSLLALSLLLPAQSGEKEREKAIATAIKKKAILMVGEEARRHEGVATAAVWSEDGEFAATSGHGEFIKIWNGRTGKLVRKLKVGQGGATDLALVDSGTRLIGIGEQTITAWNPRTGKRLSRVSFDGSSSSYKCAPRLAVAQSAGMMACSTGSEEKISIHDLKSLARRFELDAEVPIRDIALAADGKKLFVLTYEPHQLLTFDLKQKKVVSKLSYGKWAQRVEITPDGSELFVAVDTKFHVYALPELTPKKTYQPINMSIESMVFAKDGRRVYMGCGAGGVGCWDRDKAALTFRLMDSQGDQSAIALSPDEKSLCIADSGIMIGRSVIVFRESTTGKVKMPLSGHQQRVERVTFTPDGRQFVTGGAEGKVIIWDTKTGKLVRELREYKDGIAAVQFTDKNTLLCADRDGTFEWIDFRSGKTRKQLSGAEQGSYHYRFVVTPDQKFAWNTLNKRSVLVWDLTSQKLLEEITPAAGKSVHITQLAMSPKGTLVAISDGEGNITVYDTKTRKQLRRIEYYNGILSAKLVFLDEKRLATHGKTENEVRIWDAVKGKSLKVLSHPKMVLCTALSPHGKLLAVVTFDNLFVYNAKSLKQLKHSRAFEGNAQTAAFSPNSKALVVTMQDASLRVMQWKKMPSCP
jgi:WD40 repeat protein